MSCKKPVFIAFVLILTGISLMGQAAFAQTSRLYFASYLGLNTYTSQDFSESSVPASGDIELDNAASFAGALGVRLSKQFRMEGEVSYRKTDLDQMNINGAGSFKPGGDLTNWMGLLNVYYDFDVPWNIKPFIGAGVGLGHFDGVIDDTSGFSADAADDTTSLVWQVGGGLKYRVNPDLAFTGGYRYLDSSDLDFGSYEIDFGSHEFRIGLEWDLPVRGQ